MKEFDSIHWDVVYSRNGWKVTETRIVEDSSKANVVVAVESAEEIAIFRKATSSIGSR